MPELKITVNCKSMLISTAFFRFCKGIEHCYYALLFTSEPYDRAGRQAMALMAGAWISPGGARGSAGRRRRRPVVAGNASGAKLRGQGCRVPTGNAGAACASAS